MPKVHLPVLALLCAAHAFAQSPVIHRVSPLGVPPGRATELKLIGEHISEITGVWLSLPRIEVLETNRSSLIIAPSADGTGLCAIRMATTNGASEMVMFLVDELPTTIASSTNCAPAAAQPVSSGEAIDATMRELGFDYYSFHARKGKSVSIEIVASRIGSKLDPVMRIFDEKSREVAFSEDAPGAGRDCRIHFRAPATGRYTIEVRDITYGGGPQYYYRLRCGDLAFAACTFPLASTPGAPVQVLGGGTLGTVKLVSAPYARVGGGYVPVYRNDQAPTDEREPNDSPSRATPFAPPAVLNGRFEKPGDRDYFSFELEREQRWIFQSKSRSLGSPCDVHFEIRDEHGKHVATAVVAGARDASATNTFKSRGRFYLVAKELSDRGGSDLAYQIEIAPFIPGFAISVDDDKIEAKSGSEVTLAVSCLRFDFNEPIDLRIDGLPEGFSVEGARFDEKKTNIQLRIEVPEDARPGTLLTFLIRAEAHRPPTAAETAERPATVSTASTMPALRRQFPLLLYPPAELDGVIALGITAGPPAPETKRRRR